MLFLCWLVFPVLLLALALGHGLVVRRLAAGRLEAPLMLPVGAMALIVVSTALTWFDSLAELTGPVLVVIAVVGFVLARAERAQAAAGWRAWAPWAVACAAAFATFGASTFLTGTPTFTGYTQIVDIGHQFDFAAYLAEHGRTMPGVVDSSSLEVVRKLVGVGYPSGSQAPVGALAHLLHLDVAWMYQPYLAFYAAMLVPAAFVLLARAIRPVPLRLLAAFVASQPSLLVGYGQIGGVKEVLGAAAVLLAGALLHTAVQRDGGWRATVPLAVTFAAGFAVLSLTLLPWLGMLALAALLVTALTTRSLVVSLRHWLPALGVFLVLSAPTLVAATHTGSAGATVKSSTDIGNLAAPVQKIAAAGIWLTPDHRFPLVERRTASLAGSGLVLVLALGGVALAARRRDGALLALAAAGAVAFAFMVRTVGPWVELKTFVITGPSVLALAMAGAGALAELRRRDAVAWVPVVLLAGLVLYADALRYHDAALAPWSRLRELQSIGERFTAVKPALYPDFDEHAEYQLRREHAVSLVNPPGGIFAVRPEVARLRTGQQFSWDLDELDPAFVQRFNLIVLRYRPGSSRPPANYRLVYRGTYDEVWRKTGPPRTIGRAPLSSSGSPQDRKACTAFVGGERGIASRVILAGAPRTATGDPTTGSVSPGWTGTPGGGTLAARGPGRATFGVDVPASRAYDVWLLTSSVRSASVAVDGRRVGTVDHQLSYPGGWSPVGRVRLGRGHHVAALTRPGGSLAPGNGDGAGRPVGPLVFVPAGDERPPLQSLVPTGATCPPIPIDWLEAER